MTVLEARVDLRWSDLDAYGHINSVAVVRILEEARVRAFWSPVSPVPLPALDPASETWFVVAGLEVRYRMPLAYDPAFVDIELTVCRVRAAEFDVRYVVRPGGATSPSVTASSRIAAIDRGTGRPRRLSAAIRSALARIADPTAGERRD